MTTSQERVLEIIRAHPEGISTVDIAAEIAGDPRAPEYDVVRNKVNTRCRALERYGLITHSTSVRTGKGPHRINTWAVVE